MNGLTEAQLATLGFQARPPVAYSRVSRSFRYRCGGCGLWFRTIEFAPEGGPVCRVCHKESRADQGRQPARLWPQEHA